MSRETIDRAIKQRLDDMNLKSVAKKADITAQTLYNFMKERHELSDNTRDKLLLYFLH